MTLQSINPATGVEIQTYEEMRPDQVDQIVDQADGALQVWRTTAVAERGEPLRSAARILRSRVEDFAGLMTAEMGKPIVEARAEVEKSAWVCEFYADGAPTFLAPQAIETDATRSSVRFEPIGVVLAVMPWNFPFWQVFRFAAPSLMAGNAGVLKHSSNVSACALAIEGILRDAGFPEDLFRTLLIGSNQVARVIENSKVQAVTLTGSTPAGRAVASKAGEQVKKTVLELGGSDPYVLLEDADLDIAVPNCVTGRMINGGQSCIAAKRFVVPRSLVAEFERRVVERMEAIRMGDPTLEETQLGPQARTELRDELHQQVLASINQGAKCLIGGEIPDRPGAYYPATVLTDVQPGMPAYDEELFGPVAAIIPVDSEQEAIRVANDTVFGLGAAIFSRDTERAETIAARQLQAGSCFVNAFVRSDPRLPFGGIKESGYGRELSGFGIREFVNVKTVYVA
jgi:succinate-semialdehyde dehydrogenase/glutarate-semialdehyde dehydrogenase